METLRPVPPGQFWEWRQSANFPVLTNAYSAEFQGAGGVINAVTKSGTNDLDGSIFWFHRNDNLDAVDYNTKIGAGAEQPEFKRHQFGFTVGGPIVKNQTFVFGSYEGLREVLGRRRTRSVFSDAARDETLIRKKGASFPLPMRCGPIWPSMIVPMDSTSMMGQPSIISLLRPHPENYFLIKFDHTISESDSIDVRYSLDYAIAEKYYSGGDVVRFEQHPDTRRQLFNTTWRRIFSPNLFNTASASLNRSFGGLPNVQSIGKELTADLEFIDDRKFGQITGGGVSRLGTDASGGGDRFSILNLFEYADTVTYTAGQHSLKFGGKVSRTQLNGISGSRIHGRMIFRRTGRLPGKLSLPCRVSEPLGEWH